MATHLNPTFVGDDGKHLNGHTKSQPSHPPDSDPAKPTSNGSAKVGVERDLWGNDIEFLFSCIAMSVGLGNVWRFPFTALENGGGAFLIPYLIVLFLVGKPIYYLEMIVGQFSSRGSVKVFELCPAMKGVGIGQVVSISMVTTYYVAIMGITLKYMYDSFFSVLPWTECQEAWGSSCVASGANSSVNMSLIVGERQTSAELYFISRELRPITQILIVLRYYALGSIQLAIADFIGVSISTVHRTLKRVSNTISALAPQFVRMPETQRERLQAAREFYEVAKFPRTIGAIDCTHIRIQSPGGNDAELYRKGLVLYKRSDRGLCRLENNGYRCSLAGVGLGQLFMVLLLGTYYESVVALICYYFASSFRFPLPWAHCRPEWEARCYDSSSGQEYNSSSSISNLDYLKFVEKTSNETIMTSSELFFIKEVLQEKDSIVDGIGYPNWPLVLGLFVSWIMIYLLIIRGVKSSGKASYFLAIFPYIVMFILLIRAVTLEGSAEGIIYFIKPQWEKILSPKVWYAAVTQVFYSLSVCFGNIIMYSSYNKFNHNVYRDATIVTLLDTFTSLLAGFTIFGILGHLAHEIGTTDVGTVVKGGTGLAFISYPDAIAKFKAMPQIFSVLFFVMLFVLGIGSNIAMTSCTMTAIRDSFPQIPQSYCALGISVISFLLGLLYVTPGGQFILTLVDYFGASMIALTLGIIELYVFAWVYGVDRLCRDVQFMIGKSPSLYWRICWAVITPLIMTAIWIYTFVAYEPLTYKDVKFPNWAYAIGWTITAIGVVQVPIWACVAIVKQPGNTFMEKVRGAFKPKYDWGPNDLLLREKYNKEMAIYKDSTRDLGFFASIRQNLFG